MDKSVTDTLIFITGATGFVGSCTALVALEAGYRVRLSVRRPEQQQFLRSIFPGFTDKIETVVIPDLSNPEPFKDALKDVDYIFHIASPTPGAGSDVRADYVEPAIQGTLTILRAALAFPLIKKIMVMSSVLALLPSTWPSSNPVVVRGKQPLSPPDTFPPFCQIRKLTLATQKTQVKSSPLTSTSPSQRATEATACGTRSPRS